MCAASSAAGCSARGSTRTAAGATLGKFCHRPLRLGRPFEGAQLDPRPIGEERAELRGRQVHLLGVQNRPLAVVAQLLVPFDDAVPQLVYAFARLVHVDQDARWRQVLEQMRGALEEQRQIELDAPRRLSGAHVAIDRLLGEIAGKAQPITAPKLAHGVGTQGCLARGQQLNPIELLAGALGIRVEHADAVDILIQQIDAKRAVRAHGEHVEQGAAHRELAVGDHLRDGRVAREGQSLAQGLEVEPSHRHGLSASAPRCSCAGPAAAGACRWRPPTPRRVPAAPRASVFKRAEVISGCAEKLS